MTEADLKEFMEWLKTFIVLDQSDDFNKGMVCMAISVRNYAHILNKQKQRLPLMGQIPHKPIEFSKSEFLKGLI